MTEIPEKAGSAFLSELVEGAALALDGRPDGRVVAATKALLAQIHVETGQALGMGLYIAASAFRHIEATIPDRRSAAKLERDIVEALNQAARRAQRRRRT